MGNQWKIAFKTIREEEYSTPHSVIHLTSSPIDDIGKGSKALFVQLNGDEIIVSVDSAYIIPASLPQDQTVKITVMKYVCYQCAHARVRTFVDKFEAKIVRAEICFQHLGKI